MARIEPSNHKHFCFEIARQYTLFSAHAFRRFGKNILMPGRSRRIGSARVEKEATSVAIDAPLRTNG
jgi:hypothetical protein